MSNLSNGETRPGKPRDRALPSAHHVQLIFVATLLFVVLSVIAEYVLGDFIGLSAGEDLGLVLGGTVAFGVCVGLVVGALQDWKRHSTHR